MYREKYAVLRFVQQGGVYHLIMDLMEGEILRDYLCVNPVLSGSVLYRLFRETAVWMDAFHQCRVQESYRYLSPYSIVIGDNMDVALIDFAAKSSEALLRKVQSGMIREQFLPKHQKMYQNTDIISDLYSFGRVMQFVLQTVNPEMKYSERQKMKRIISRSLGERGRYKNFGCVSVEFPYAPRGRMLYVAAGLLILAAAGGVIFLGTGNTEEPVPMAANTIEPKKAVTKDIGKETKVKEQAKNKEISNEKYAEEKNTYQVSPKPAAEEKKQEKEDKEADVVKQEQPEKATEESPQEQRLEGTAEDVKPLNIVPVMTTQRLLGGEGYNYNVDICASVGESGGYLAVSSVCIRKNGGEGSIGYLLEKENQLLMEGALCETGEYGEISGSLYHSGSYLLKIWEICRDGTVREGSFQSKEIPMEIH